MGAPITASGWAVLLGGSLGLVLILEGYMTVRAFAEETAEILPYIPLSGDPDPDTPVEVVQAEPTVWLVKVEADEEAGDRDVTAQLAGTTGGFVSVTIWFARLDLLR